MPLNLQTLRARLASGLDIVVARWAVWVAAAVFAAACSAVGYAAFKSVPASYPEFIAGYATVNGGTKVRDYAMLAGFLVGFVAYAAWLANLMGRVSQHGAALMETIDARLVVAVIPALAWAATLLMPQAFMMSLFWLGVFLVIATPIALGVMLKRPAAWMERTADTTNAFNAVALLPLAAIAATLAVAMIGNRLGPLVDAAAFGSPWFPNPDALYWSTFGAGLLAVALGIALVAGARDGVVSARWAARALIVFQVLVPALFLVLLPAPQNPTANPPDVLPTVTPGTWYFLGALTLATWADLVRLWRKADSVAGSVSVLALVAVLVYCRVPDLGPPTPFDDYHFGEDFIPWWSWVKHGMIPLWDFTPPRGLINYKMGLLAELFTEETASGLLDTAPYHFAVIALLACLPLTLALGRWRMFLVLSFATLEARLGDIDVLMTAGLCLLIYAWTRCSHVRWLVTWLVVGIAAVLIAPGQGGLLVIATAPGGLWRLYSAVRDERRALLTAAAASLVVLAVLGFATPLGLMVAGAVRYGAGQSAVNGIANGVPWYASYGSVLHVHPWLFEILRFAWIGAGGIAAVLTLRNLFGTQEAERSIRLFVGATVVMLCGLYIIRSAVRIDPGYVGRPGWTSLWALALLLPILITTYFRGVRQITALAVVITGAAALTGQFSIVGFDRAFKFPFVVQPAVAAVRVDGPALGMPNLGHAVLDADHVHRLVGVKHQLDRLLDPDETFLDMTNRGAQYFYFDRVPPSDLSAFYNMITTSQQMRAVEGVQRRHVAVALTGADNSLLDGLPASLRAPMVYRYLVLNFVPVRLDGYDFMLRPDRLPRAGVDVADPRHPTPEQLRILDQDFFMPNLEAIPTTWGKVADELSHRMRVVKRIDNAQIVPESDVVYENGAFRITGEHPIVGMNISDANLRGSDAGLLRFDFNCPTKHAKPQVEITWRAKGAWYAHSTSILFPARKGTVIVPLDAAPRWLLAPSLEELQIGLARVGTCESFTLNNVVLAQRLDADALDKLAAQENAP